MRDCCEPGTYGCYVTAFICECCNHPVVVDECLRAEIEWLHRQGIRTIGCCCGHGKWSGYIQVLQDDCERMEQMGYVRQEPEGDIGQWCFGPKSERPQAKEAE